MKSEHYERYLKRDFDLDVTQYSPAGEILEGQLKYRESGQLTRIEGGIPRFVPQQNYADNFGLQWNIFRSTQLDSATGLPISTNRFFTNTGWTAAELKGKTVLEVGSGAGRFTEVILKTGATLVTLDYSSAVDANYKSNGDKGDVFIFQGDLYNIPFPDESFDYVFCYGVLQHTPDPDEAFRAIFRKLKVGGKISIDFYRRRLVPTVWSTPKYFWRPITTRMKPTTLLKVVQTYVPLYLPFDTFMRKIPFFGQLLLSLIPIPCWNYLGLGLTPRQRKEWAIMDTFDALGAKYDYPKTLPEVEKLVGSVNADGAHVFHGSNGVVANARRVEALMASTNAVKTLSDAPRHPSPQLVPSTGK